MEIRVEQPIHEVVEVCLLAGKIMLQSGAETYRVEDTMSRIASSFNLLNSHSFVMPTGIIFQPNGVESAKLIRIVERTTDLQKVNAVNGISRQLSNGELSIQEAHHMLCKIDKESHAYSIAFQIAAASIASACFTIMFQGTWPDFVPAMICGGLGYTTFIYFHRLVKVKFFAELIAAFLIGIVSFLLTSANFGQSVNTIIIGSVMPLVPGLLITNAIRDLMAGHLVSGLSRGAEAFLTAFAIGTGVAIVFTIFH
ncbi:threonine/serine exporter family protein [Paenibacillus sp. FA6]|uniref:threonine/serine exporter family protein n=1 Tax=Paenibacillus sp. FA6 TaxID=3413029 RepID=UPI003F6573E2